MTIQFSCNCGKKLKVADEYAGRTVKCPACKTTLTIPAKSQPAAPPPPPPAAPPPKAPATPAGMDDLMPVEEKPAPTKAAAANNPDALTCPKCNRALPRGTVICECGYSLRLGRTVRSGYAENKGPKPVIFLGREWTLLNTIPMALVLGLVVGLFSWWWFGWRVDVHVRSTTPVFSYQPIGSLSKSDPTDFTHNLFNGVVTPTRRKAGFYAAGAGHMLVMKQDADGDQLLVRVGVAEKMLKRLNMTDLNRVLLNQKEFEIEAGGVKYQPLLLAENLPDELTLDIDNISSITPQGVDPVSDVSKPLTGAALGSEGVVSYDGSPMASGSIKHETHILDNGSYFVATGQVKVNYPHNLTCAMDYQGDHMTVHTPKDAKVWRSDAEISNHASVLGFDRYEVALLFPRPPLSAGRMTIYFHGQKIGSVSASYGATSAQQQSAAAAAAAAMNPPAANTGAQATAPATPAPPTTAGPGVATNAPNSRGEKVGTYDYFGALAQAKRKSQNTAAASNMKQILEIIIIYRDNHHGQLPDNLDELIKEMPDVQSVLVHPRTKAFPGFVYVKPDPATLRERPEGNIIILYEALDGLIDPNGSVGYLDGTVEVR